MSRRVLQLISETDLDDRLHTCWRRSWATVRTGRPIPRLLITEAQKAELELLACSPTTRQAIGLRARLILACAEGKSNRRVSDELQVSQQMVSKWRLRFFKRGVDGLRDEPRPGTSRKTNTDVSDSVVSTTLLAKRKDGRRWSTRSLAKQCGVSHSTVHRIWRSRGVVVPH